MDLWGICDCMMDGAVNVVSGSSANLCLALNYITTLKTSKDTYCDESLVETVKAQIPDEPPVGKRWDKPKVEVRDHHEWSAAHHPRVEKEIKCHQSTIICMHMIQIGCVKVVSGLKQSRQVI